MEETLTANTQEKKEREEKDKTQRQIDRWVNCPERPACKVFHWVTSGNLDLVRPLTASLLSFPLTDKNGSLCLFIVQTIGVMLNSCFPVGGLEFRCMTDHRENL